MLEGSTARAVVARDRARKMVVGYRRLGMIQLDAPRQASLSQEAKLRDDQLVDLHEYPK